MSKEITFIKYQKRGAYHWQQIKRSVFSYNAYVSARYQQIIRQISKDKNLKILDIGCGDGALSYLIYQKIKANITGIDTDINSLEFARRELQKRDAKVKFIKANAYKLPFKNSSFDVIIASEIIEHLGKPKIMLKEIKRVLKPNGQVIITTPVKISDIPEDKMHIKEFTPQELKHNLEKYFKKVIIKTSHPLWLKKLYLFRIIKLNRYHLEPFRWLINFWVFLTTLNPFFSSFGITTNQIAVCKKPI